MFFMFEACLVSVLLVLNMCTAATALSALTEQLKMGGWRQHEPQIASLSRQPPDNSSVELCSTLSSSAHQVYGHSEHISSFDGKDVLSIYYLCGPYKQLTVTH